MKKTVNINLAGTFFHIDEDAFGKLNRYLDAIKLSFADPQGQDEIIRDIESRISELFAEKIESKSQVISITELDEVIAVMGQPEDYVIDEEIFEDNPASESNKRRFYSSHRQLFRDIDDKFIAGVSSGLGHYIGIDAIWVRILWILFTFFSGGIFIVFYALFWVLVAPAESTSDKLKMNREAVNITNIEKKFKEGYENVSDKIKDADYDKYKQKAKSGASGFFGALGNIFLTLFKIFVKFFGIILIIVSLSTLVALIVGFFTTGTMGVVWGNHELMDYVNLVDTTGTPLWLVSMLALFSVGIPFFILFILGLKMLISNLKSIGTPAKIILLVVWVLSLIGLGILGLRQATEQAYDGEEVYEKTLSIQAGDTLNVSMNSNTFYEYRVRRSSGLEIRQNENGDKIIYSNDVRLIVRSTNDSTAKIVVEKKAEGRSFIEAKNRAQAINHDYSFDGNNLSIDGFLTTAIENKYREQEVEIILYLPIGTILFADENTYSFHRNSSRYEDILNNGDEEKYLRILKDRTECIDCVKIDKTDDDGDSNNSDLHEEVNEVFKTVKDTVINDQRVRTTTTTEKF